MKSILTDVFDVINVKSDVKINLIKYLVHKK